MSTCNCLLHNTGCVHFLLFIKFQHKQHEKCDLMTNETKPCDDGLTKTEDRLVHVHEHYLLQLTTHKFLPILQLPYPMRYRLSM